MNGYPLILLGSAVIMGMLSAKSAEAKDLGISGKTLQERLKSLWSGYGETITEEANRLGVPISTCAAVLIVETSGSSFGKNGKPIIRFERKIFNKYCPNDLSWKDGNQEQQYKNLETAIGLNRDAAYMSISVGIAQIMGFNHSVVGFDTAEEMYDNFSESTENQILGFFKFIEKYKGGKLIGYMKTGDFSSFAYSYNGPGYAANKYDTKMADAKKTFTNMVGIE